MISGVQKHRRNERTFAELELTAQSPEFAGVEPYKSPASGTLGIPASERGTWPLGNDRGSRRKLDVGMHENSAALNSRLRHLP